MVSGNVQAKRVSIHVERSLPALCTVHPTAPRPFGFAVGTASHPRRSGIAIITRIAMNNRAHTLA